MADYIERSYIRKMAMLEMAYTMETETDAAVVLRMIDDAPAADVASVVRCKDCKWHRELDEQERKYLVEGVLICTSPDATDDGWNSVFPDHFCSYGERKEGTDG